MNWRLCCFCSTSHIFTCGGASWKFYQFCDQLVPLSFLFQAWRRCGSIWQAQGHWHHKSKRIHSSLQWVHCLWYEPNSNAIPSEGQIQLQIDKKSLSFIPFLTPYCECNHRFENLISFVGKGQFPISPLVSSANWLSSLNHAVVLEHFLVLMHVLLACLPKVSRASIVFL